MSCHNIGRAVSFIIEEIINEYDNNRIPYDVANALIHRCIDSISYCDGNEDEAYEYMEENSRCGLCLTQNPLHNLYDINLTWKEIDIIFKKKYYGLYLNTPLVCDECLGTILKENNIILNKVLKKVDK